MPAYLGSIPDPRHDRNPLKSKSLSRLEIFYYRLTPVISRLLIVNTMLPTHYKIGQAVLEWRHLVSDLLAVLRFDHAYLTP